MRQRFRTIAPVLLALCLATQIFRPQISLALVSRGDDFLYRSQLARALAYYRRALIVDPHSAIAADRLAFFSLERNQGGDTEQAVRVCSSFLQRAEDDSVRADCGLANLKLHRFSIAQRHFAIVGQRTRDPRYLTFAAWSAWRGNRPGEARRLWKTAQRNRYRPAITALRVHS